MSDQSFLAHFITEDVYVLKEDVKAPELVDEPVVVKPAEAAPKAESVAVQAPVEEATPKPEPIVETATQASEPEANTPTKEEAPKTEPVATTPAVEAEAPAPKPEVSTPVTEESPALFEPLKAEEPEPVYLKPLPTEGNNLKHCLVLVESDEAVLEANLKGLLEKIMGAVKRSPEDILLVNVKEASEDQIEALLSEQNHRHLLAFGTTKVQALAEVGNYELVAMGRKHYLKAHSLKAISENIEFKKALWKTLQEMFS